MKQIRLILAIILGAILSQSANAFPLLIDQFQDYANGQLGDAGTGKENNWNTSRSRIVVTNGSGSLDGTALGLVVSAGDKIQIVSTANTNDNFDTNGAGLPNGCYNKFVASGTFPATTNANLYCSFLYRFNDNTNFPASGVSMIAALYLQSGGIQSSPSQGYWHLFARSAGGNNLQIGIAKNALNVTHGVTNWATTTVAVGQTNFIVVRLQIAATNGVSYYTNDIDDLWINPPANTFGTNEANVPTPDISSPAGDGAVPASNTGPGRFFIVDDGLSAYLDELRISTNWADATPPFGQCLTASFTTQPTNLTQCAEINASFFAKAAGSTGPSFQWQISKDGGTTWSNISGAVRASYTTPNLQLATDNGNKYRAIVNVACDGSSATSSVATVTLTAPVVTTSPSLIMDDTFASGVRTGPTVTANNSVWWTSVTADLDSSPLDSPFLNGLTATPITNTSSLYLGYFVNDISTRLPVHLAIGTQITVTLNFIPISFNIFTNNGPLRLGLFDYADGGIFATADSSALTGSGGQAINVRGYMLSLDFGKVFSTSNPMTLYVRNNLQDNNLMGTTGDYNAMGDGGPLGIDYSNAPAFKAGSNYVLTLSVARIGTNTCSVNAAVTGSGLNLSYTAIDTNSLGYHRFDAVAVRPNKAENAPDYLNFPEFKVQVGSALTQVSSLAINSVKSVSIGGGTNNVTLTWIPAPSGGDTSAGFSVRSKSSLTNATWTLLQSGINTTNYTDTTVSNSASFYRVSIP